MVKRGSAATVGRKRKKTKDDFFEDEDEQPMFLESDDERQAQDQEESEEEDVEANETAEEKRLRLGTTSEYQFNTHLGAFYHIKCICMLGLPSLLSALALHTEHRRTNMYMYTAAKAYLDQIKASGAGEEGSDDDAVAERLRQDALDAIGHLRRRLAHRLEIPPLPLIEDHDPSTSGVRLLRGHALSVTAIALSPDESSVFSGSKDGTIFRHTIETGARCRFEIPSDAARAASAASGGRAEWVRTAGRRANKAAILALAVSFDGRYLVSGGGDGLVHVFDARSGEHLRAFPGHKDAVTALTFRDGTHQLFSGSLDRSIKIWDLEDMAYVDTLFGHQAEVLGLDALRAERVVSCGADRTCRIWKIPEESQLVFRGHCLTIESCAYVAGGEWVTGSADGSIALWNASKKKPIWQARRAHYDPVVVDGEDEARGAGCAGDDVAATWVGSVAVCRGADVVASGAGDGAVRVWKVLEVGGRRAMEEIGAVPLRGFVNGLEIAKSGRFMVAAVGQEQRMGRWLRDRVARNGVAIIPLTLRNEDDADEARKEGGAGD
jgi:ribosomal RNA-processing protein 9